MFQSQSPSFFYQTSFQELDDYVDLTLVYKSYQTKAKLAVQNNLLYLKINDKTYCSIRQKQIFLTIKYSQDGDVQYLQLEHIKEKIKITQLNQIQTKKLLSKLSKLFNQRGFNQQYKPLKRLGRGSFATVYLIQNRFNKQQYAAKVFIKQQQYSQANGRQALQNQISIIRSLNHTNILKLQGVYQTQSLIYVVLQYISGGTLDNYLRKKMSISGEEILRVIKQILLALDYLDKKNIMHRDLKPQNIMMRKQTKQWVLTDFGLAASTTSDYLYPRCGTLGFMAPQILNDENNNNKYNQICDIYSLGIIFYELLLGKSFGIKQCKQNDENEKQREVQFTEQEQKNLDGEIIRMIKRMLQRNPKQRISPCVALQSKIFSDVNILQNINRYIQKQRQRIMSKILKNVNKCMI